MWRDLVIFIQKIGSSHAQNAAHGRWFPFVPPGIRAINNLYHNSIKGSLDLPPNLPVPVDDGACAHLTGTAAPSIPLSSTSGVPVDVPSLDGLTIIFCYPRTGAPGENIPESWNLIPGARGCTPQACSFRDTSTELLGLGVQHIFGLSTQDTAYQTEVKERLHLPYDLLSDEKLEWVRALNLPTFEWEGKKLVKRLAIAVEGGEIIKTWYPIFPSDRSAHEVIEWLRGAGRVTK